MVRISLSADAYTAVEQKFKRSTDRQVRARCQAVLMAHRGRKRHAIAEDLGVPRTTVKKWLDRYCAQGLEGLHVRRAPGNPPRIPEALAPTIVAWVTGGLQGCGVDRANWPMMNWRRTCTGPQELRSDARRCGRFVNGCKFGPIDRPTGICETIRNGKRRRTASWRN